MQTVLSLNTGLKYGEADFPECHPSLVQLLTKVCFLSQPCIFLPVMSATVLQNSQKMNIFSQDPGSYKHEIEKRQILFNPISQNGAKFLSINLPNVPKDFAILVLQIIQNVLYKKVWVDLQKFENWSRKARDQLWRQKKKTNKNNLVSITEFIS